MKRLLRRRERRRWRRSRRRRSRRVTRWRRNKCSFVYIVYRSVFVNKSISWPEFVLTSPPRSRRALVYSLGKIHEAMTYIPRVLDRTPFSWSPTGRVGRSSEDHCAGPWKTHYPCSEPSLPFCSQRIVHCNETIHITQRVRWYVLRIVNEQLHDVNLKFHPIRVLHGSCARMVR